MLCFTCGLFCSSCKGHFFDFSEKHILILSNGDKESLVAADYLYTHLDKRNRDKNELQLRRSEEGESDFSGNSIYLEVVPDLQHDYEIQNRKNKLSVYGKNKLVLNWISYQLIDHLADFHDLNVEDLPPNYLDFKDAKVNFRMSYRDPHLLPNMEVDMSTILMTHNVDRDWGLWGHNLKKVFPDASPTANVLALVKGKRDPEQYCFSSEAMFQFIKAFVMDEFGIGNRDSKWFMISPNDNDIVCTCEHCQKAGNTTHSATSAVVLLLNRLASEFPTDHFYTTAYRTTKIPADIRLADNAGVFLSTIDLSKAPVLNPLGGDVKTFTHLLNNWKQHSQNVYLWDYISNFDDYLTPYPALYRVQQQLAYFESKGVKGLFLNGSGYDYSPFDDVKTYVLSALMLNPVVSVPDLVKKYHQRFYPVTGDVLSDYLIKLEENVHMSNKDVGIYTSFKKAMNTYFDVQEFEAFYDKLIDLESNLVGAEKIRIERLLDALSYTKLQSNYHQGKVHAEFLEAAEGGESVSTRNDEALARLKTMVGQGLHHYKEEAGDLSDYLSEWEQLKYAQQSVNKFKITKGVELPLGKTLDDFEMLTNNLKGFSSDFNQGWVLSASDIEVEGELHKLNANEVRLDISFLLNKKHRMLLPEGVEVLQNKKTIASYKKNDFVINGNSARLQKKITPVNDKDLKIKIYKSKDLKNSVIACDEIQLY